MSLRYTSMAYFLSRPNLGVLALEFVFVNRSRRTGFVAFNPDNVSGDAHDNLHVHA